MTAPAFRTAFLAAFAMLLTPSVAQAQPATARGNGMPNMRAISGKPLPDRGMALGTVTVRVARQTPANPAADVEITALVEAPGGETRKRTAKSDASGRALFESLPAGHQFHAEVTVDSEKLSTETFPVPEEGGVRVMLVAGLGAARAQEDDSAPLGDDQHNGFKMGIVTGSVRRDPNLPFREIAVLAVDETGQPLGGKTVELDSVRVGGKVDVIRQVTGPQGIARFVGVGGASPVTEIAAAVVMRHGSLQLGTEGFGIPTEGGLSVQLAVPRRTADPGVITVGAGGRVIMELRDDSVSFIESLPLENTSDKLFDPGPGGVEIRLPKEFVNAEGAEGEHKIEIRKGLGVAVHGIIAPHHPQAPEPSRKPADEVTFGFVMPLSGSSRSFEQTFPTGMGEFTFISDQIPGLTIDSTQITGRQEQELNGKKYWLMQGETIPPGGTLRFTARGLPAPDNMGRIVAAALALVLVAAAIVFGRGGSAEKKGIANEREELIKRREKLFAELVTGETPDRDGRLHRGQLVQKLESVYREMAALDERLAV